MNSIKQIEEWAKKYDMNLTSTDPRFARAVTVIHEEGTIFHFQNAFVVKRKAESEPNPLWYCIFTEHHRFHVYHEDDAKVIQHGGRLLIEEIT